MLRMNLLVCLACLIAFSSASAADWPQWAGPDRNFTAKNVELADRWPESGPRRLWSRDLGVGYAGIVAADGALYTMYRKTLLSNEAVLSMSWLVPTPSVVPLTLGPATLGMLMLLFLTTATPVPMREILPVRWT